MITVIKQEKKQCADSIENALERVFQNDKNSGTVSDS